METERTTARSRGVAMIMVLTLVVFASLLGFAGLSMVQRDVTSAGSVVDVKTKQMGAWGGIDYAVGRMMANPAATVSQLQLFVNDSNQSSPRRWFHFGSASRPFDLVANAPDWHVLVGGGGDNTSFRVRLVALDLGPATGTSAGSMDGRGMLVTLESIGRGRRGDRQAVVATYRLRGIDVQAISSTSGGGTPTHAFYLSGSLNATNIGQNIAGDLYVSGNVSLNATAPYRVRGRVRINGNFASNARLDADSNSYIAGLISTNSGAPMTFGANLGVGGGFGAMNAPLTVGGSLNVYGPADTSWNQDASLLVGRQLFLRSATPSIQGRIRVGGNAIFGNGITIASNNTARDTVRGGLHVLGGTGTMRIDGRSDFRVFGPFVYLPTDTFDLRHTTLTVGGNARFEGPFRQTHSGRMEVAGKAQFDQGITAINHGISNAIEVHDTMFLQHSNQNSFNGGVRLRRALIMNGSLHPNFSNDTVSGQWRFHHSAVSRIWTYQNPTALSGGQNPRVRDATTNNTTAHRTGAVTWGDVATPAVPWGLTHDSVGMRAADTMTSIANNPPDTLRIDATHTPALLARMVTLTSTLCTDAGIPTNHWTATHFNTLYNYFSSRGWLYNGYMVVRIDGSSPLDNLHPPAGTFNGKAVWVIEKTINVNGNWPASRDSTNIQVLLVRGSGSLGEFGSPGNIWGYIHVANNSGGTQRWGTGVTLFGAMHFTQAGSSVTGNVGTLDIVLRESVFRDIATNLPNALSTSGSCGTAVTTWTNTRVLRLRESRILAERISTFR